MELVRSTAEFESNIVSVERINEYTKTPQEVIMILLISLSSNGLKLELSINFK